MLSFKTLAGINYDTKEIMIFDVSVKEQENGKYFFTMRGAVGNMIPAYSIGIDEATQYYKDISDGSDINWTDVGLKLGVHRRNYSNFDSYLSKVCEKIVQTDYNGEYYKAVYDCSCTDYPIYIDGNLYNFETSSCGQCIDEYKNYFCSTNEFVDWLYTLWDAYHCQELPTGIYDALKYAYLVQFKDENIEEELTNYFINIDKKDS